MSRGGAPGVIDRLERSLKLQCDGATPEPRSYAVSPIPTIAALPFSAAAISGLRTGFQGK